MNIELRKVYTNERFSEETACFRAEIWIDGKKEGTVENEGHGGADHIHPHALAARLEIYAKTLPAIDCSRVTGKTGDTMPSSAEMVISDLLEAHKMIKTLTRMFKSKLVIVRGGKCYGVGPFKNMPEFARDARVIAKYVKNGDTVLNTLPMPEAVKQYLATAVH